MAIKIEAVRSREAGKVYMAYPALQRLSWDQHMVKNWLSDFHMSLAFLFLEWLADLQHSLLSAPNILILSPGMILKLVQPWYLSCSLLAGHLSWDSASLKQDRAKRHHSLHLWCSMVHTGEALQCRLCTNVFILNAVLKMNLVQPWCPSNSFLVGHLCCYSAHTQAWQIRMPSVHHLVYLWSQHGACRGRPCNVGCAPMCSF